MTAVKIAGKPTAAASGSIELQGDWLWNHPGGRVLGVVELRHTERSEPAPDVEKDRTVTLSISMLELASGEQEETLRQAARALYLLRTATGTLDPEGEVEWSDENLRTTVRDLGVTEALRLRMGIRAWADRARNAFQTPNIQGHELAHELEAVHAGLLQLLSGTKEE